MTANTTSHEKRLRVYEVLEPDSSDVRSYGFVVAENSHEARRIALKTHPDSMGSFDGEYIRVRVRWIRNADPSHLSLGWYDWELDHVRLGMIGSYVDEFSDEVCDSCGTVTCQFYDNGSGKAVCDECMEAER